MASPHAVAIVRLQRGEGERLRAVRLRALAEAPDAFSTTFSEACAWDAPAWEAQVHALATFVAVADGADVGLARGERDLGHPARAWLRSMWVAPEWRRRGVGRRLVAAVTGWALGLGCDRIALDVADGNTAAIACYDALGFVATGVTAAMPPHAHRREHQRERPLR